MYSQVQGGLVYVSVLYTSVLTMYQLLSTIVCKSEVLQLLFHTVRIFSKELLSLQV